MSKDSLNPNASDWALDPGVNPGHTHTGLGGLPLALTGATAPTRYAGGTVSGAPVSGTFAVGDFVIDETGEVWICTVAGSPGTWTEIGGAGGLPLPSGTPTVGQFPVVTDASPLALGWSGGINSQSGTSYTFVPSDNGTTVMSTNADGVVFEIALNATENLPNGAVIAVLQYGAGGLTVTAVSGVTLNGVNGASYIPNGQYQFIVLVQIATNVWVASGGAAPPPSLSVVQTVGIASGASASSISPTISPTTAGNLLVCVFVCATAGGGSPVPSITDSASQTWTAGESALLYGSTVGAIQIFYKAGAASISTVTMASSQPAGLAGTFYEISGASVSPADAEGTGSSGDTVGASPTATTGALAQVNEIAIGGIGLAIGTIRTISDVTSGWTVDATQNTSAETDGYYSQLFPAHQIVDSDSTLTLAGTLNATAYWGDVMMTFKGL